MDKTILVVDDNDDIRDAYCHFLALEGFKVIVASNGQEAVEKALETRPDLILMDLALPVLGGLEATRRIKSDIKTQHIPVVLVTAHVRKGPSAVIQAGCEGFLVKPCSPAALRTEIDRVLKRASQHHST
jgi:two-component system cell cycle response regulator DivK